MTKDATTEIRPEADLHCHILPAWDDGPRSLNESLEMASKAAASGIKKILVTPHVGRQLRNIKIPRSSEIAAATQKLQAEFSSAGIDIELIPAAELTMDSPDLPELLQAKPWLTIGAQGYYALIESSHNRWPSYADRFMHKVSLSGVTPIIAHPERYPEVQKDIRVLQNVVEKGALVQLTARSLVGGDDRRTKQCSVQLLKAGMVAIIASDAHSLKSVLPGDVVALVSSLVGEKNARRILEENPRKILAGEPVYNPDLTLGQQGGALNWIKKLTGRSTR
jgi:protein-tyrosine phosphatase